MRIYKKEKKMTKKPGYKVKICLFILILTLIVGCTSLPTCDDIEGTCLELTFDGENCTYEGPTELNTGTVKILFRNKSESTASAILAFYREGKTVQDMIDYNGPEPTTKDAPSWAKILAGFERIYAGESETLERNLKDIGTYTLLCWRKYPHAVWLGTGLNVE